MSPKRVLRPDGTIQDLARPMSTYTNHEQDCILDGSYPAAHVIRRNQKRDVVPGTRPVPRPAVTLK